MSPKQKWCPPRTPISCHLIAPTSDDSIHIVGAKFISPAPLKRLNNCRLRHLRFARGLKKEARATSLDVALVKLELCKNNVISIIKSLYWELVENIGD
jgi:hypothetical protein